MYERDNNATWLHVIDDKFRNTQKIIHFLRFSLEHHDIFESSADVQLVLPLSRLRTIPWSKSLLSLMKVFQNIGRRYIIA